jgi:type VI protein secretion system component Hcp
VGRAQFEDIDVEVPLAKGIAPDLYLDTAEHRRFSDVKVELFEPGTTEVLYTYDLNDVLLDRWHAEGGRAGRPPILALSLTYARITETSQDGTNATYDRERATGA